MEGFLALLGVPQGGRKDFLVINGSERFQMAEKIASPATSSSGLHRYNTQGDARLGKNRLLSQWEQPFVLDKLP